MREQPLTNEPSIRSYDMRCEKCGEIRECVVVSCYWMYSNGPRTGARYICIDCVHTACPAGISPKAEKIEWVLGIQS